MHASEISEALWERAFQLSYFILRDRSRARECLSRALEKLVSQRTRERRRGYWRGRRQELAIRRISRPAEDSLQWLIFLESEGGEREQESQGLATEADMIVRYIKHLARLTTASSSFHVNVGFNRLLRRYTTPEVQQIYELATGRYPGSEEYRRAKGKLLEQLAARFEPFLKIRTGQHRELQFETHEDHQSWSGLVEECLRLFTPWSGRRSCFQQRVAPGALPHAVRSGSGPDRVEISRCHWFMHSTCYGQLALQLGLDSPKERLSVPRFLDSDDSSHGPDPGPSDRRTAPLSQQESHMLRDRVASVAVARSAITLQPLKILADGIVCARFDASRVDRCGFTIPEGARLLELRSDTAGSDRVVAIHWLDYDEGGAMLAGEYTIALKWGRRLALKILTTPGLAGGQGAGAAVITVESSVASRLLQPFLGAAGGNRMSSLRPALVSVALATVGVLLTSGYFLRRIADDRLDIGHMESELAEQKGIIARLEHAPKPSAPAVTHFAFAVDLPNVRGAGKTGEPVVTFAPGESVVVLELPVVGQHGSYRATLSAFPQEQELLSEMGLRPVRRGNEWIVEFALPAALVEGGTHYLLALRQASGADTGRYLFEVRTR